MKQWLNGVGDWLNYVRNYKESKDNEDITDGTIVELNKKISKLKKEIKNRTEIAETKDSLIQLLEKRIQALGNELSSTKKRNNELRNTIAILYKQNEDLEIEVNNRELLRRKAAGKVGGLKATITKYEKELERKENKIHWLKTNQKAPSKEEIIAYETRMKEVEKRIKGK